MIVATSVLLVSLLGIVLLFSFKYRESKTGRVLFPTLRDRADVRAIELKSLLLWSRTELEKLPPFMVLLSRNLIHETALFLASLARRGEEQAHRLADIVSHKHHFERRATRSEFLRQVSEHPMRNRNDSNGAGKNGEVAREIPNVRHEPDERVN
ncbi:MAG: hypothetical protein Q8R25_03315 [bacterium]|nr:hypothetical protein [bacterium]